MTDPTAALLRCPVCETGVVLAEPMRTAYLDGEPDATGYQCGGTARTTPCDWFLIRRNGSPPLTYDALARAIGATAR